MTNELADDFGSWRRYFRSGRVLCSAAAVALWCTGTTASAQDALTVHVYGPGGPGPAMADSAQTFNARYGVNVIVTAGSTSARALLTRPERALLKEKKSSPQG